MSFSHLSKALRAGGFGGCLLVVSLASSPLWADQFGFHLDKLPRGKNVTMPTPARTFVPISSRITLTSTDMPQSLSFRAVSRVRGPVKPLKVSIYDKNLDRVSYHNVTPGTPFLYSYKNLSSITVLAEPATDEQKVDGNLGLQVESDKPLEIAH